MTQHVDQVGGTHYSAAYQHWDWAAETGLGYLEANATKYLGRHRKKGGRQDLEKALSYVLKLLAVPGLTPARERLGYSPAKLARYLRASGLEDTPEAALTVAIDSWRTDNDLRHVAAELEALIHATGG